MSNEKDVIVNKNILNKSKDCPFLCLFRFCFLFIFFLSKKANLHLYLYICECRLLESYIQYQKNKICSIYRKRLFKEISKTSISKLYFISTLSLHLRYICNIVKYCYSLPFTDSVAFTFNKRPNLHLVSLFYKNCSYPT